MRDRTVDGRGDAGPLGRRHRCCFRTARRSARRTGPRKHCRHAGPGQGGLRWLISTSPSTSIRQVGPVQPDSREDHVRDLVEQVLFTAPGERVNRPQFGSGLLGLVFEPNGDALAAATRARVDGALQLWLSDVVRRRRAGPDRGLRARGDRLLHRPGDPGAPGGAHSWGRWTMNRYFCCDERRREAVRATGVGNGIEYLEVVDSPDVPQGDRQRLLRVHFVNVPSPALLAHRHRTRCEISGGVRVTSIQVVPPLVFDGDVLVVRVDRPGDFSTYTLSLGERDGNSVRRTSTRCSRRSSSRSRSSARWASTVRAGASAVRNPRTSRRSTTSPWTTRASAG